MSPVTVESILGEIAVKLEQAGFESEEGWYSLASNDFSWTAKTLIVGPANDPLAMVVVVEPEQAASLRTPMGEAHFDLTGNVWARDTVFVSAEQGAGAESDPALEEIVACARE